MAENVLTRLAYNISRLPTLVLSVSLTDDYDKRPAVSSAIIKRNVSSIDSIVVKIF